MFIELILRNLYSFVHFLHIFHIVQGCLVVKTLQVKTIYMYYIYLYLHISLTLNCKTQWIHLTCVYPTCTNVSVYENYTHSALNSYHYHHSRESKLSVKAGSNICLGLSSCFETNLLAYDRDLWNQIQLISPLNYILWLSEDRDAIAHITVVLTQLAFISCLRGIQRDRIARH